MCIRDRALGVGAGDFVAGGVVGAGRQAAVGALLAQAVAEAVYAVAGGEASRVADAGQVIAAVVLVAGLAGGGVGDLAQAVEGVVGEGAALVQGCLLYTSRCV